MLQYFMASGYEASTQFLAPRRTLGKQSSASFVKMMPLSGNDIGDSPFSLNHTTLGLGDY